jgi:hypothetical protein
MCEVIGEKDYDECRGLSVQHRDTSTHEEYGEQIM